MQLNDLDFGGWGGEHSLHPQLPIIRAQFLGREDLPEDVLGVMLLVFFFGLGGVGGLGGAAHQNRSAVFYEGCLFAQHRPFYNFAVDNITRTNIKTNIDKLKEWEMSVILLF